MSEAVHGAGRAPARFIGVVSVLVYHAASASYLVLRRSDSVDVGAGEWEAVTGRVEHGESFEDAARREVREEIGADVELDFIIGTAHFYRGARNNAHEALGVRYVCSLHDRDEVTLSNEHDALRWITAQEATAELPVEHRLRRAIERADVIRTALPPEVVAAHRRDGFLSE